MNFTQEFIIHPVGQGLFYSGKIIFQNHVKFRMVFDCGSDTKGAGENEVEIYRKDSDFIDEKIIDLLVISHFDKDHVNQIENLLAEGIKIKKIVMPFITFSERLYLFIRHLYNSKGYREEDEFYLRISLDPIGTMNEYLSDDSELYFIDGEPDSPIPPELKEPSFENENNEKEERFVFDFEEDAKTLLSPNEIISSNSIRPCYKIDHSNKATVKSGTLKSLMEFLFYKRKISENEKLFFDNIQKLFFEKYSIDENGTSKELFEKLIKVIKTIKSSTIIKKLFEEAKLAYSLKSKKGELEIENLNTTSICLLHRNLTGIFNLSGITGHNTRDFIHWHHIDRFSELIQIQKLSIDLDTRIETRLYFWPHFYAQMRAERKFIFPNVMLTSDSFLLTTQQVNEYLNHYKNYWNDFWLFQIPHHGSDKSSNNFLHSNLPNWSSNIINFGIGNSHSHPSKSTILDLIATGNSSKIIPVTQFNGLRFGINI